MCMSMKYKAVILLLFCCVLLDTSGCVRINSASLDEFLLVVARNRDVEALDRLIERAGHIDARDTLGRTFLYISALHGYIEFVDHLLQRGADPTLGKSGRSSLHAAAQTGRIEIIELLLEAGVDVDIRCRQERTTPLMRSARNVHSETVSLLLAHGADPLARDRSQHNALNGIRKPVGMDDEAFDTNVERTITLLAEAGVDVNHESRRLRTPLMRLCYIGSEVGVKTLLKFGADPRAVNRNGKSVLDFAEGNDALTRLIKEAINTAGSD